MVIYEYSMAYILAGILLDQIFNQSQNISQ